jgi:hypothetical protein
MKIWKIMPSFKFSILNFMKWNEMIIEISFFLKIKMHYSFLWNYQIKNKINWIKYTCVNSFIMKLHNYIW